MPEIRSVVEQELNINPDQKQVKKKKGTSSWRNKVR